MCRAYSQPTLTQLEIAEIFQALFSKVQAVERCIIIYTHKIMKSIAPNLL